MLFSLPVVAASFAIAAINQRLYGSPTSSGYGSLEQIFELDRANRTPPITRGGSSNRRRLSRSSD